MLLEAENNSLIVALRERAKKVFFFLKIENVCVCIQGGRAKGENLVEWKESFSFSILRLFSPRIKTFLRGLWRTLKSALDHAENVNFPPQTLACQFHQKLRKKKEVSFLSLP